MNQFVGTLNFATSAEVEDRIKEQIVLLVYSSLGDMKNQGMGVADLGSSLPNIEQVVLSKTNDNFALYGVAIDKISGLYISLPEEVQKAVDTRSSMQITGTNYVQYQSGQAMREAATNPSGGTAGVGVGLGAGLGMGYTMVDAMRSGGQQPAPGAAPPSPQQVVICPKCGTANNVGAKFCQSCGTKLVVETVNCPKCGEKVSVDAKFCPNCGNDMKATKKCPKCGTESPVGTKLPAVRHGVVKGDQWPPSHAPNARHRSSTTSRTSSSSAPTAVADLHRPERRRLLLRGPVHDRPEQRHRHVPPVGQRSYENEGPGPFRPGGRGEEGVIPGLPVQARP